MKFPRIPLSLNNGKKAVIVPLIILVMALMLEGHGAGTPELPRFLAAHTSTLLLIGALSLVGVGLLIAIRAKPYYLFVRVCLTSAVAVWLSLLFELPVILLFFYLVLNSLSLCDKVMAALSGDK